MNRNMRYTTFKKNITKAGQSVSCGISIGLLFFFGLSDTSFGSDDLGFGTGLDDLNQMDGETDIDRMLRHFSELKMTFDGNPLLDNPHVHIIELKANRTWLGFLVGLTREERKRQLQKKHAALIQEYEERRQLAADPEKKKNTDAQRKQHISWLKPFFELPNEALAAEKKKLQVKLRRAQKKGDQNSTTLLEFRLHELDTLKQIRPSMSKEAFEALCEWKQTIERLPLDKLEEELQRNLNVIQDMLRNNEENPEELVQQIRTLVERIETTLDYLQTITRSTNSGLGSPSFPRSP
jgi:hypothetical protein